VRIQLRRVQTISEIFNSKNQYFFSLGVGINYDADKYYIWLCGGYVMQRRMTLVIQVNDLNGETGSLLIKELNGANFLVF
jgi:hypothetical protein